MGNAIDRLAAELMRLPAKDWERLVELRRASPPDETAVMESSEGTHRSDSGETAPGPATASGNQT